MKKFIIIILLISVNGFALMAQDMPSLLKNMPQHILPLLSRNNILDFIDFMESNMKAEVTNNLKGRSEMTELSGKSCHIRLTEHSEATFSIVSIDGKDLILLTRTYTVGEKKSHTRTYFTFDWKEQKKEVS